MVVIVKLERGSRSLGSFTQKWAAHSASHRPTWASEGRHRGSTPERQFGSRRDNFQLTDGRGVPGREIGGAFLTKTCPWIERTFQGSRWKLG